MMQSFGPAWNKCIVHGARQASGWLRCARTLHHATQSGVSWRASKNC